MSLILYYSNYCEYSKELLVYLARNNNRKRYTFICIDNREIGPNGKIQIILKNGQRLSLVDGVEKFACYSAIESWKSNIAWSRNL